MSTQEKLNLLKSGKLTAEQNVKNCLQKIKKENSNINALLYVAEKEALAYLQDYNLIMNLPYQIIEETIDSNCKDLNYPCEKVRQTYKMYKSFIWWKDKADLVSKVIINSNKINNIRNLAEF